MTEPYLRDADCTLYHGDAVEVLRGLPDGYATACVTSPPYLDSRPEYESPTLRQFSDLFEQLARVLTDACLINVGRVWRKGVEQMWWLDLIRVAEYSGWSLVDTLIWIKPNANPIHGQVFANRHEYVLILARPGDRLNEDAIRSPYAESSVPRLQRGWINHTGVKNDTGRRAGRRQSQPHPLGGRPASYVIVHTGGEKGNPHPAPMALGLADHLVKLACKPGQRILDPFAGSGTTAIAARRHQRLCSLIDVSETYCLQAARRLQQQSLLTEAGA